MENVICFGWLFFYQHKLIVLSRFLFVSAYRIGKTSTMIFYILILVIFCSSQSILKHRRGMDIFTLVKNFLVFLLNGKFHTLVLLVGNMNSKNFTLTKSYKIIIRESSMFSMSWFVWLFKTLQSKTTVLNAHIVILQKWASFDLRCFYRNMNWSWVSVIVLLDEVDNHGSPALW